MTHEHFSLNFDKFYCEPPKQLGEFFNDKKPTFEMKNLGFVRQYPYGDKYNINYEDADTHRAVVEDLKIYKKFGGGSIVENTTCGINRDLKLMYQVSKEIGVHVIAGTGHYLGLTQSSDTKNLSVEQMIEIYKKEIQEGIEVKISNNEIVNIKCGVIGEIGSVFPITEFERRSIIATAQAQNELKCGVTFHPGRDSPDSPFEVMRIYLEAGGDGNKCVMSHLDRELSLTLKL